MDPKKISKHIEVVTKLKDAFEGVKEIVSEFVDNVEDKIIRDEKVTKTSNIEINENNSIIVDGNDNINEVIKIDDIEIKIKNSNSGIFINVIGAKNIQSVNGDIHNEGDVSKISNVNGTVKIKGNAGNVSTVNGNIKF